MGGDPHKPPEIILPLEDFRSALDQVGRIMRRKLGIEFVLTLNVFRNGDKGLLDVWRMLNSDLKDLMRLWNLESAY